MERATAVATSTWNAADPCRTPTSPPGLVSGSLWPASSPGALWFGAAGTSRGDRSGSRGTPTPDVYKAWDKPVIAITGSAGKTTTKDLTANVVAASGRRVLKSERNYNNGLGLPLAVLATQGTT